MKKLLPLLFCFIASNAFASSADSGKCPWKMPFSIMVHGVGFTDSSVHHWMTNKWESIELDTDFGVHPSTETFWITVDTANVFGELYREHYFLNNGVLDFSELVPPDSALFTIHFAPAQDSIVSLQYLYVDTATGIDATLPGIYSNDTIQISALAFDDTSIFAYDSSFANHAIRMVAHQVKWEWNILHDTEGRILNDHMSTSSDFTATSVTLSGLFRPTTFSDLAAVKELPPQASSLAIHASNGSTVCSFDISDHARELEIYSPLGSRVSSVTIAPTQSEVTLPRLPAGFYFLKLGGAVGKLCVGE